MKPEKLAGESEHSHQIALFSWAALNARQYPELRWLHAIPNGGERNIIVAGKMKAEGVRTGVSDIFLPVPRPTQFDVPTSRFYCGLYVEMKKPAARLKKGPNGPGPWDHGGVTDDQKEFLDFAVAQGYYCAVCYSWTEAVRVIVKYLTGKDWQP